LSIPSFPFVSSVTDREGGSDEVHALDPSGRIGPYVVQAAIASLHADEPRDWPQIAALHGELGRLIVER
jgi:RNA polymerase sigma-70 factor, ECF subfamily